MKVGRLSFLSLVLPGTLFCSSEQVPVSEIHQDGGLPEVFDELCGNGVDDNGNGLIDEGCPCIPGERQACFDGPVSSRNIGVCRDGWMQCQVDGDGGTWGGACIGAVLPSMEVCNGVDDDCDGTVDEGCPCAPGERRKCGAIGFPLPCRAGEQTCGSDGLWAECVGQVLPEPEKCGDGIDNDCNGLVDEGCDCVPEPEICGDGFDNDCNGLVDEGCEQDGAVGLCDMSDMTDAVPCPDGYLCVGIVGDVLGVCQVACTASEECDGVPCIGDYVPGYCGGDCDPVSQVGCPTPLGCYTSVEEPTLEGSMVAQVVCAETGSSPLGGSCDGAGDCVPGSWCVENTCRPICRVNGSDCAVGETCRKVVPAKIIYGVEYGACD